jgi:demethylmenaquinone methyltransferase/2-methoxy-6-polyprenyl-1,4-benzoquinol methylase
MSDLERLLAEQADYYRERAGEYDDWWFRRGRYDHGPETNARWFSDVAEAHAALERFKPSGNVLELACGTGLWTERLLRDAKSVTVVDGSPEMLDLCRSRVGEQRVSYVQADLFAWEPERTYEVCFFGFWLSHVPEERLEAFWAKVGRAVGSGGRVFFIDSLRHDRASALDHALPEPQSPIMLRRLADGREYQIVKRFYEPAALQQRLVELGWSAQIQSTREFFIHGQATPITR